MAINLSDNIKVSAPKSVDSRYLNVTGGTYLNTSAVCASIPVGERHPGLTVLVNSGASNIEYWFKDNVNTLIEKKSAGEISGGDFVTGATNLGLFTGYTGIQRLALSSFPSGYDGLYYSQYNYYYRDSSGYVRIGSPTYHGVCRRAYVSLVNHSWLWNVGTNGWILSDVDITNNVGNAVNGITYAGTPYTATTWSGFHQNGSTSITATGSLTTGTTTSVGVPVYARKQYNELNFRTIVTDTPDTVSVSNDDYFVRLSVCAGSGALSGASNGLHTIDSGKIVVLGGTLTTGTTINGLSTHDLSISNVNEFQVSASGTSYVLNKSGMTLSGGGSSVNLNSTGGLKYAGNYSANYTNRSLPDVGYVTGLTSNKLNTSIFTGYTAVTAPNTYLKLNQTVPQTVTCGQPIFNNGIIFGTPSASLISGHTKGKMFYDENYKTVSVHINDNVSLQLGQEELRYVYNATGSLICNGQIVYVSGVHTGGPGPDVVNVCLAIASNTAIADKVLGMATENIPTWDYGFVTTKGNINDLNTLTSPQYSGMTIGDELWLSPTVAGAVINAAPAPPNAKVYLGRLITKNATAGKVFVNLQRVYRLGDLSDVSVPSPAIDEILKFNGTAWVNGPISTSSASAGVNFYNSTPIINVRTQPLGLTQDGTAGNGVQVASLSKIPVTTGGTQYVSGLTTAGQTRAMAAWIYNSALGKTYIDAGTWKFSTYARVDSVAGGSITTLTRLIYQVVSLSGSSTVRITGSTANVRTAIITSNQFNGTYFAASATNTTASWLQLTSDGSQGIYQISSKIDNNRVNIIVPTGFANVTGVTGNIWNKLFGGTTPTLTTSLALYEVQSTQSAFSIAVTDKLGQMAFVTSDTTSRTAIAAYNGSTNASYFNTPLVLAHNDLAGLQGGIGSERFHTTMAQNVVLANTSGVNTGDETKSTIESKLTGTITTHTHPYSGLTGLPSLTAFTGTVSHAINGLRLVSGGTAVALGGTLTGNTTISGNNLYGLSLNSLQAFNLGIAGVSTITDSGSNGGLRYAANYCSNYVARSIPDVAYVTGRTSNYVCAACNGLTKIGNSVVLGGALTGNTKINLYKSSLNIVDSGNTFGLHVASGDTWLGGLSYFGTDNTSESAYIVSDNAAYTNKSVLSITSAYDEMMLFGGSCSCWSGLYSDLCGVRIFSCHNTSFSGMSYNCDYSSRFTARSIPDVAYVTGRTSTSGVQTASNGLTKTGTNVTLGGSLVNNTGINANTRTLAFSGTTGKVLSCIGDVTNYAYSCVSDNCIVLKTQNGTNNACIDLNRTTNTITTCAKGGNLYYCTNQCMFITAPSGATYTSDYSPYFTANSLVTKNYVDSVNNIFCVANTTTDPYDLSVDLVTGFVAVSNTSCILLPSSPKPRIGRQITVTDVCGNALSDPIFIDGNGYCITNNGTAIINTDYGSITFLFNGYHWSPIAFVN